jgi:hypothetical protein
LIFISYRIEDSLPAAARLDEELEVRFGPDAVFRDQRRLEGGSFWGPELESRVQSSSVVLVLIGSRWQTVRDRSDGSRLFDPEDWVRREIRLALDHVPLVIPVLLDDASMPAREWLATCGLAELADRHFVRLRAGGRDYQSDRDHLLETIAKNLPPRAGRAARLRHRLVLAAIAAVIALVGSAVALPRRDASLLPARTEQAASVTPGSSPPASTELTTTSTSAPASTAPATSTAPTRSTASATAVTGATPPDAGKAAAPRSSARITNIYGTNGYGGSAVKVEIACESLRPTDRLWVVVRLLYETQSDYYPVAFTDQCSAHDLQPANVGQADGRGETTLYLIAASGDQDATLAGTLTANTYIRTGNATTLGDQLSFLDYRRSRP